MHRLTLTPKHYKSEAPQQPERRYLDFVVSGQALSQFVLPELDLIGAFGWMPNKAEEHRQLDQFEGILPADLQSGRISLYVCAHCGDISCGAITARIEVADTTITWKDFGYETGYQAPELIAYTHIGPFIFDKQDYINVLEKIRVEI